MGSQRQTRRLFIAMAGIILIIGVALFGQLPGDSRLWIRTQNTGHIPLFGLMAIAVLHAIRELRPAWLTRPAIVYLLAAVISLILGLGVEFGQMLTKNHNPDMTDVGFDLAGTLLFLAIFSVFDPCMKPVWRAHRSGLRPATLVLAFVLVPILLAPLAGLAIAGKQRDAAFPVIVDFSARWSGYFLELQHADLYPDISPVTGHPFARLAMEPGRYPGIAMVEPYPDWSGYRYLVVEVYSGALHPHRLTLRVHDRQHNDELTDRFNKTLIVDQGMNVFRIPLAAIEESPAGRSMDMTRIAGLVLFAHQVKQPFELYLGKMWLE